MNIIFILILVSMVVAGVFLAAFFWSVKSGQYEDTYTPSVRMLFEEGVQDASKGSDTNANDNEKENEPKQQIESKAQNG